MLHTLVVDLLHGRAHTLMRAMWQTTEPSIMTVVGNGSDHGPRLNRKPLSVPALAAASDKLCQRQPGLATKVQRKWAASCICQWVHSPLFLSSVIRPGIFKAEANNGCGWRMSSGKGRSAFLIGKKRGNAFSTAWRQHGFYTPARLAERMWDGDWEKKASIQCWL